MPLLLDIFGSDDPVLLLLFFLRFFRGGLVVFLLLSDLGLFFLLAFLADDVDLLLGLFLLGLDDLSFVEQFVDLVFSEFVALVGDGLDDVLSFVDEGDDLFGDFFFDDEGFF